MSVAYLPHAQNNTECTSMDDHVSVLLIRSIMVLPLPSHILLDIADHAAGVSRAVVERFVTPNIAFVLLRFTAWLSPLLPQPGTDDRWKILIPFEGFARVLCNHTPGDRKFEWVVLSVFFQLCSPLVVLQFSALAQQSHHS